MAKEAKSIIRAMFTYCVNRGALSAESQKVMRDYFTRVSRLKPKSRKKKSKAAI